MKKKLVQVDLSKVDKEVPIEVSVDKDPGPPKTTPTKPKKPPTEKQLAAREKLRLARMAKLEAVKAVKEKAEVDKKILETEKIKHKEELASKRKQKRLDNLKLLEEAKANSEKIRAEIPKEVVLQKAIISTPECKTAVIEERKPTIPEAIEKINTKKEQVIVEEPQVFVPTKRIIDEPPRYFNRFGKTGLIRQRFR